MRAPSMGRRARAGQGLVLLALTMLLVPASAAAGNPNPRVLPPSADVGGVGLGDWFARWLNWIVSVPPMDCNTNQDDKVFFIPHTFPGDVTETSCRIPAGSLVLASAGGIVCTELDVPPGADLRDCVTDNLPIFSDLRITVDGRNVQDIGRYLAISSEFDWVTPDGTFRSVAGGWQVILAPLAPGEHTIVVHDVVFGDVAQVTAHVTVVPGGR